MDGSKSWLVNKNGKILGPWTTETIVEGFHANEYGGDVEFSPPFGGWRPLVRYPELVQALRSSGYPVDDLIEKATDTTAHQTSSTQLRTRSLSIDPEGLELSDITVVQGRPLPEPRAAASRPMPSPSVTMEEAKVFAWGEDPRAGGGFRFRGLIIWLVVLAAGIGAWWLGAEYRKTGQAPLTGSEKFHDFVKLGDQMSAYGKSGEAMGTYRQALELNPTSDLVKRRMIPLMLREERQIVTSQRWVDELKMALTRPEDLKEVHLLQGLVHSYSGRWEEATQAFNSSLDIDPQYLPARFNRAMTYFMSEDFDSAATDFFQLQGSFLEEGTLMYALSLSKRETAAFWDEVESGLRRLADGGFAYQQETFLVGAWIAGKSGEDVIQLEFVDGFLSLDGELSHQHYRDPLLFLEPLAWTSLSQLCLDLKGQLEPLWRAETLEGACHIKSRDFIQARDSLERSYSREPQPTTQALLAQVFYLQGEFERARAILGRLRPPTSLGDLLEVKMLAREQKWSSLEQALAPLEGRQLFALQLEYFRSLAAHRAIQPEKARFHMKRAEQLSPTYIPLRELEASSL